MINRILLSFLIVLLPLFASAQKEEALEMARDLKAIVDDLTPANLVIELSQEYVLTASELTKIVLDEEVYPELRSQPKVMINHIRNHGYKKFGRDQIMDAVNDNYTHFSAEERTRFVAQEFGEAGTQLSAYVGTYTAGYVRDWSGSFSPLEIDEDGKLFIEGIEITNYLYDHETSTLTFGRVKLTHSNAMGIIVFSSENGTKKFKGWVSPRVRDGGLHYESKSYKK